LKYWIDIVVFLHARPKVIQEDCILDFNQVAKIANSSDSRLCLAIDADLRNRDRGFPQSPAVK
jgi:hypothetical protein